MLRKVRATLSLGLCGAKPQARVAPLDETRAVTGHCHLEFEKDAGEQVVLGFEHAKPLGKLADLFSSLRRQFRLSLSRRACSALSVAIRAAKSCMSKFLLLVLAAFI
jgi:hypothetical protein